MVMTLAMAFTGLTSITTGARVAGVAGVASDWPQWRGPGRDGVSRETGLLKQWPATGPAQLWSITGLGEGYGSMAVVGERVYVQGTRGEASVIYSLNRADGRIVWSAALGPKVKEGRGNGPRSTPTVDGDKVYVLTENGDLACLKASDGGRLWNKNILKEFGGENPYWLISESPLIDGDRLFVSPGGRGAGIVALDKLTGKTIWAAKELSDTAGYSSSIVADISGIRTVMNFTSKAAVGVRASDGKLMWTYRRAANGTANCATPVYSDNKVFFTSNYDTGGALLALSPENGEIRSREIYFTRDMMNHHGGVVLVNGYLYGFSNSILTCIEFTTGKKMWSHRSVGKGAISYADGMLYLMGEDNTVGLADATPEGYREKGRFQIADQGYHSWAHPVISGGRLYIRNQGMLTSYDVRAK